MRPGYDTFKGVHVSWGPLSNLKLLGFFIFENRNSLEVLSQCFYFIRLKQDIESVCHKADALLIFTLFFITTFKDRAHSQLKYRIRYFSCVPTMFQNAKDGPTEFFFFELLNF